MVSGVSIAEIGAHVGEDIPVVRAMPNTAVAIGESMTCLAALEGARASMERIRSLFDSVGLTMVIDEEQMTPATALGACGVAFFLRAIRSASQGGIEVGFHADEAIRIAARPPKGRRLWC